MKMKKLSMFLVLGIGMLKSYGQTTVVGSGEYKSTYLLIQHNSAEATLVLAYALNGQPVNQYVLSHIQDFNANQTVINTALAFNFLVV